MVFLGFVLYGHNPTMMWEEIKISHLFCSKESIKEFIEKEKAECKDICENYTNRIVPTLAIIQVGDNPASNRYIKGKIADCDEVGIRTIYSKYEESISEIDFAVEVSKISSRDDVHGVIIQKPLPHHLENVWGNIINIIPKEKDVDGFRKDSRLTPCTAQGIMNYLTPDGENFAGYHCVIVGRSELVGRPLAKAMLDNDATVTVCHSKTENLEQITSMADILVVAVGKAKFIDHSYVKPNATVIDVGINFDENGKMCGDVDYDDVKQVTGFCTPVPGGVGLLTRLALLQNVLNAFYIQKYKIYEQKEMR